MKKTVFVALAIVIMLAFSIGAFAGGITSGTTRNTTQSQADATRGYGGECRQGISDDQALDWTEKLGNYVAPGQGAVAKYFLKAGKKTGELQRENGGVTMTGGTTLQREGGFQRSE